MSSDAFDEEELQGLKELFQECDKNEKGHLTPEELLSALNDIHLESVTGEPNLLQCKTLIRQLENHAANQNDSTGAAVGKTKSEGPVGSSRDDFTGDNRRRKDGGRLSLPRFLYLVESVMDNESFAYLNKVRVDKMANIGEKESPKKRGSTTGIIDESGSSVVVSSASVSPDKRPLFKHALKSGPRASSSSKEVRISNEVQSENYLVRSDEDDSSSGFDNDGDEEEEEEVDDLEEEEDDEEPSEVDVDMTDTYEENPDEKEILGNVGDRMANQLRKNMIKETKIAKKRHNAESRKKSEKSLQKTVGRAFEKQLFPKNFLKNSSATGLSASGLLQSELDSIAKDGHVDDERSTVSEMLDRIKRMVDSPGGSPDSSPTAKKINELTKQAVKETMKEITTTLTEVQKATQEQKSTTEQKDKQPSGKQSPIKKKLSKSVSSNLNIASSTGSVNGGVQQPFGSPVQNDMSRSTFSPTPAGLGTMKMLPTRLINKVQVPSTFLFDESERAQDATESQQMSATGSQQMSVTGSQQKSVTVSQPYVTMSFAGSQQMPTGSQHISIQSPGPRSSKPTASSPLMPETLASFVEQRMTENSSLRITSDATSAMPSTMQNMPSTIQNMLSGSASILHPEIPMVDRNSTQGERTQQSAIQKKSSAVEQNSAIQSTREMESLDMMPATVRHEQESKESIALADQLGYFSAAAVDSAIQHDLLQTMKHKKESDLKRERHAQLARLYLQKHGLQMKDDHVLRDANEMDRKDLADAQRDLEKAGLENQSIYEKYQQALELLDREMRQRKRLEVLYNDLDKVHKISLDVTEALTHGKQLAREQQEFLTVNVGLTGKEVEHFRHILDGDLDEDKTPQEEKPPLKGIPKKGRFSARHNACESAGIPSLKSVLDEEVFGELASDPLADAVVHHTRASVREALLSIATKLPDKEGRDGAGEVQEKKQWFYNDEGLLCNTDGEYYDKDGFLYGPNGKRIFDKDQSSQYYLGEDGKVHNRNNGKTMSHSFIEKHCHRGPNGTLYDSHGKKILPDKPEWKYGEDGLLHNVKNGHYYDHDGILYDENGEKVADSDSKSSQSKSDKDKDGRPQITIDMDVYDDFVKQMREKNKEEKELEELREHQKQNAKLLHEQQVKMKHEFDEKLKHQKAHFERKYNEDVAKLEEKFRKEIDPAFKLALGQKDDAVDNRKTAEVEIQRLKAECAKLKAEIQEEVYKKRKLELKHDELREEHRKKSKHLTSHERRLLELKTALKEARDKNKILQDIKDEMQRRFFDLEQRYLFCLEVCEEHGLHSIVYAGLKGDGDDAGGGAGDRTASGNDARNRSTGGGGKSTIGWKEKPFTISDSLFQKRQISGGTEYVNQGETATRDIEFDSKYRNQLPRRASGFDTGGRDPNGSTRLKGMKSNSLPVPAAVSGVSYRIAANTVNLELSGVEAGEQIALDHEQTGDHDWNRSIRKNLYGLKNDAHEGKKTAIVSVRRRKADGDSGDAEGRDPGGAITGDAASGDTAANPCAVANSGDVDMQDNSNQNEEWKRQQSSRGDQWKGVGSSQDEQWVGKEWKGEQWGGRDWKGQEWTGKTAKRDEWKSTKSGEWSDQDWKGKSAKSGEWSGKEWSDKDWAAQKAKKSGQWKGDQWQESGSSQQRWQESGGSQQGGSQQWSESGVSQEWNESNASKGQNFAFYGESEPQNLPERSGYEILRSELHLDSNIRPSFIKLLSKLI